MIKWSDSEKRDTVAWKPIWALSFHEFARCPWPVYLDLSPSLRISKNCLRKAQGVVESEDEVRRKWQTEPALHQTKVHIYERKTSKDDMTSLSTTVQLNSIRKDPIMVYPSGASVSSSHSSSGEAGKHSWNLLRAGMYTTLKSSKHPRHPLNRGNNIARIFEVLWDFDFAIARISNMAGVKDSI